GSSLYGYEFTAPLNADGHLDAEAWKATKPACTVRRFARGAADEHGRMVHVGKGWHFDYDAKHTEDDERVFKLDRHIIRQGEYLSITEHDGVTRTFKIASVHPLSGVG
ncbi:MAG: hypothetical protein ABL996_26725, partial [Micropepsaceae bacterium]